MPDLATIWFLLIGVLLVGYAVLDGFDLGAGMLHLFVARDDRERRSVLTSIGPVWDGNEVWLLTAGGALFAAFPPVYATVFSGFYLALILVLVALIFRAVALEFRSLEDSPRWRATWDVVLSVASFLPALLFGVAIGNVLAGVPLDAAGDYTGGLVGLLRPFPLLVGLCSVALFVVHGASWLTLKTEGALQHRSQAAGARAWPVLVALWALTTVVGLLSVTRLSTPLDTPAAWLAAALFLVLIGAWRYVAGAGRELLAFVCSSGAIAALLGTVGAVLYPELLPEAGGQGTSLTVANASSSDTALSVMLVLALIGMPLVIAYTAYIYRAFRGKVELEGSRY